tara:strand:+ start:1033 stop:1344 length:312 start_codon:yes stop_codon:yes gene_type:complete
MFTNVYPFAARPVEMSRSAVFFTTVSLRALRKKFQEFQPNTGVAAAMVDGVDVGNSRVAVVYALVTPSGAGFGTTAFAKNVISWRYFYFIFENVLKTIYPYDS